MPDADKTGNFKLVTGAMAYRVNSDNSGRATGVSYYGPDGSDNTIEAEIVILTTFIYDNTRLLLLSKTDKFPNGLANSSGQLGKHMMAHMMANVFVGFDDRHMNIYMGPSAQKHTLDDFNADNFDHSGVGFIRGSQISIGTGNLQGGPIALTTVAAPPGIPRWGAAYRDFLAQYYTRHAAMVAQTENLAYPDQMIDLDPTVRDAWGLPAPRLTYDWRRPNERARVEFMQKKMEEIGRAMGASLVWRAPVSPAGAPGAAPRGRDPHGERPQDVGREPLRPELGYSECVRRRQLDLPEHERIQSNAHDPGARLHERRRDRQSLQEEPGIAAVAPTTSRIRVLPRVRTFGKARGRTGAKLARKCRSKWGIGNHGNGKNRCCHRRRRRGRRHPRGRARQSRHESHRARARPASQDRGLQSAR